MYTITILMYLTLIAMVGAYHMLQKAAFRYLTRYVDSTPTPVTLSMYNMSFSTPSLLDTPSIWDFYDKWDQAEDELLEQSIATYEAEMDREWEDEIQGYMFCDIATMMALTTENLYERYEDLPFTASMIRSAKPGNRGIVVMDNSDYERSVGTHNHKDHNHR